MGAESFAQPPTVLTPKDFLHEREGLVINGYRCNGKNLRSNYCQ